MLKKIDQNQTLPKIEEEILKFWQENQIFEKTLENRKGAPEYIFYDGPPFATGTPHYGHILTSAMKDAVPRYQTMKGKFVERKWGWDCHGLPIENIAEKELGIKTKKQIEEIGVEKFNEFCRSKVLQYVDEWKKIIPRLGRFVDMENSYKTMDLSYMESVWWVFKQLWDKNLIYESYRSMHICPRCETTLSQSEVAEGYRDIKDLSLTAKFELIDQPNTSVLAWTTTPWTLIGNVALAVGADINYTKIKIGEEYCILAFDRIKEVIGDQQYEITEQNIKGESLVGKKYKPLFDYYNDKPDLENKENGWQIVSAPFVTTEEGTGVVHIAPAFGEDDMNLGKEKDLPFIQHVGMDGIIKDEAEEFSGLSVKPAENHQATDIEILKYLAEKNLLFSKENYTHSYPHCWRCDTPLLNYATSSWFVKVEAIKEQAIENAKEINWSPSHIKKGRFGKWLEGARDWSISRQRFWASVIPIWKCSSCGQTEAFGSIAELEQKSGQKITDLHKHIIDRIEYSCQQCQGKMNRIPDVLDTWFDSGSMPYASFHYPFENREKFDKNFPAQFIAEGQDQTRAWFYYLHILSTSIFQKPAFKNVIVNGTVLAEDGKKMSKRLQNYPDPMDMFNKYGADVVRFYFLSSPVVSAENLEFSEKELGELSRGTFRMILNSYSFFMLYASIDGIKEKTDFNLESQDLLDHWILSELNELIIEVNKKMDSYDLMRANRAFVPFIENLSNWYIRRSRKRFWKAENDTDKNNAFETLHYVLVQLSKLLAPFTPFIAEEIFKNLTGKLSVHLEDYPLPDDKFKNDEISQKMASVRSIVEAGLKSRAELKIKVRQPLSLLQYSGQKLDSEYESIISEEVNVKAVEHQEKQEELTKLDPNLTKELIEEGIAREIIRNTQTLRKKSGLNVEDRITLFLKSDSQKISEAISTQNSIICQETLATELKNDPNSANFQDNFNVEGEALSIGITKN